MYKINETTMAHMKAHKSKDGEPNVFEWAEKACKSIESLGPLRPFTPYTVEFEDLEAPCQLVLEPVSYKKAPILLFRREGRKFYSRGSVQPLATTKKVTFLVNRDNFLVTAYFGESAPRETFDSSLNTSELLKESTKFWMQHALVVPQDCGDVIIRDFDWYANQGR